jgi:hypothetical protein
VPGPGEPPPPAEHAHADASRAAPGTAGSATSRDGRTTPA